MPKLCTTDNVLEDLYWVVEGSITIPGLQQKIIDQEKKIIDQEKKNLDQEKKIIDQGQKIIDQEKEIKALRQQNIGL